MTTTLVGLRESRGQHKPAACRACSRSLGLRRVPCARRPASFTLLRTAVYLALFLGASAAMYSHYVIGLLLAAAAVPAHTLALPNVGGYLPDADRRGLCTCCCPRSGGSGASRPPTGAVWRAWVSTQVRRNTAWRCGFRQA